MFSALVFVSVGLVFSTRNCQHKLCERNGVAEICDQERKYGRRGQCRLNEKSKRKKTGSISPCASLFQVTFPAKVPCPLKPEAVLGFNCGTHIYAAGRRGTNIRKNGETDPFDELVS
ncbi:hypothetical protein V6N13_015338 [Hibiscus sabdariffa]